MNELTASVARRSRRSGHRSPVLGVALAAAVLLTTTIAGAEVHERLSPYWPAWQAESISTVRGMPVRGRDCRGVGRAIVDDGVRRYRRFRCAARARAPWETYDTIAVLYMVHSLGPYAGPASPHTLTQVHFIGGPGIP